MKELSLQFTYRARYFKLGEIKKAEPEVWFVAHGYGQLARFFIKKFELLSRKGICVIAPEGLSRFYLEDIPTRMAGGTNRVGATWMTRENREMDIENYINYLQSIYDYELNEVNNARVTLLGFSQGAATITRWALSGRVRFDCFILWASIFPADMNFDHGKNIFANKEIQAVYGKDDPFISPDKKKEMEMLSQRLQVVPTQIQFEGGHEINDAALEKVILS